MPAESATPLDDAREPVQEPVPDPIMTLLSRALERQADAAESTATEVRVMRDDLTQAIHSQSDRFEAALRSLAKPVLQLAALAAILLASIAGVQFYGQWSPVGGVTISTTPPGSASATPDTGTEDATRPLLAKPVPSPLPTATAEPAGPVPVRDD